MARHPARARRLARLALAVCVRAVLYVLAGLRATPLRLLHFYNRANGITN